jgi:hypothetical protein
MGLRVGMSMSVGRGKIFKLKKVKSPLELVFNY